VKFVVDDENIIEFYKQKRIAVARETGTLCFVRFH